jgi:hypothetical protein
MTAFTPRGTVSYMTALEATVGEPGTDTFLDNAEAVKIQLTENDTGNGSFQVVNADVGAIDVEDVIRVWLDGNLIFVFLVEQIARATIAPGEESAQVTKVSGRGLLALLDDTVVYPAGGVGSLPVSDHRLFFFGMLGYDDSGAPWEDANQQAYYGQPVMTPNWHDTEDPPNRAPHEFPAIGANYIWNSLGDVDDAPVGTVYFRKTFTLSAAANMVFYASGDNLWQLWLDGIEILGEIADGTTWLDTQRSKVFSMSDGPHVLAARVTNTPPFEYPDHTFAPNPAFLIVAGYTVNTATGEETGYLETDNSWRVTSYLTEAPPITCGQVLNILLAESFARACIVPDPSFTNALDSDGQPWNTRGAATEPITDFTTNIGSSLLDVLRQMAETYVDFELNYATFVLSVWDKSAHIPTPGVALVSGYSNPTTGNLRELNHTTKA